MAAPGSVTNWLRQIERGEDDAARHLWDRFSPELHRIAKQRLRRLKNRDFVDEEDIVSSAFASFCLSARNGDFEQVADRSELLGLLIVITLRKSGQRIQYATAMKRGLDQHLDQDAMKLAAGSELQRLVQDSDCPATKMMLAEDAEILLARLPNGEHRAVAVMRLAGHTNEEIAVELGYTRRTIQRMLVVIRGLWEISPDDSTQADSD
ncbi:MAG: ECF-type sigma factor [Planctomycetaceae bacterium]